jgi:hypothetical protein
VGEILFGLQKSGKMDGSTKLGLTLWKSSFYAQKAVGFSHNNSVLLSFEAKLICRSYAAQMLNPDSPKGY